VLNKAALETAMKFASKEEQRELQELIDALDLQTTRTLAQKNFLPFVEYIWPDFISGEHHRRIAKIFDDVADGKLKRVIINLAPRHTKSQFASRLLPAWFIGKYPKKQVLQVSNTSELAEGFGREVRNLLGTEEYNAIFPDVELRSDSKAAGRWSTNQGGVYFATGVGAAIAGRGADLAIIDDPHTEAEALSAIHTPGVYDKVFDWYTTGIRQRLQPGGAIIVVQTRWSLRDLTGQILDQAASSGAKEEWKVFDFPAILPSGRPLWSEFWSLEELESVKRDIPLSKWEAQYQQNPTSDETAIIKRDWWQEWPDREPPKCEYTLMSFDTAYESKQSADYSAMTYWGIFYNDETSQDQIILLDAWRGKLEFPDLKEKTLELYKEHQPDSVIIEKRASGASLIQELRTMGVPVQEFIPSRGNDKITRLHAIADVFASGMVWAPTTRWAAEVIEEVAGFPNARNDDFVDTVSQAITRFRKGGFVKTRLDKGEDEFDNARLRFKKANYY